VQEPQEEIRRGFRSWDLGDIGMTCSSVGFLIERCVAQHEGMAMKGIAKICVRRHLVGTGQMVAARPLDAV